MSRWLALAGAALLATGCNNDCYNLAKNVCECQPTATAIASCSSNISLQNSIASPSSADLARCTAQLEACDCRTLSGDTAQAKVACLMARPNPSDAALGRPGYVDGGL